MSGTVLEQLRDETATATSLSVRHQLVTVW
jgi:hypothetical protein